MVNWLALSTVKNLDKIVLYIILFFGFIAMLITLGIAGATSSVSMLLGLFVVVSFIVLLGLGRVPAQIAVPCMIFGGLLIVWNPASSFTIGDLMRSVGMVIST